MSDSSDVRMVFCAKLKQELPGLRRKPYPNELGERLYREVSQQAWDLWLEHSKRVVNEYRLDVMSPQGREVLLREAERFFFGDGGEAPPDYVPPGVSS